jgi:hypothetical protein
MTRSTGITVSAVVVIIGSIFTLLCGTLILRGSIFPFNSSSPADAGVNLGYILVIEALVTFVFGGWGLPSAIPGVRFGPDQHARPLSITIIGWYLIIGSALGPLSILFTSTFSPGLSYLFFSWGFFSLD